jgi:lipoate-protein ligase A
MWAPDRPHFAPIAARAEAPRLGLLLDRQRLDDDLSVEQRLVERAADGGAVSAVWEPSPSLVVPGSYRRFERFDTLCERFAARGWPVSVRRSGGGLVPQGPGMVNVSLAWRTRSGMGHAMQPVYEGLCELLEGTLAPFGIDAEPQAVEGSFCDGRWNLAVGGRKVAGTAQFWQRISPTEHVVLAHACLLVEADLATLVRRANEFEAQLGSDKQYRLDAIANLVPERGPVPADAVGQRLSASTLAYLLGEATRASEVLC